jgi:hypothetical protein
MPSRYSFFVRSLSAESIHSWEWTLRLTETPPECYIINEPVFAYCIVFGGKSLQAQLQLTLAVCASRYEKMDYAD